MNSVARGADRGAADAGVFGFAAGVAWSVGLSMSQEGAVPVWLRVPLFVGLAVATFHWVAGWRT